MCSNYVPRPEDLSEFEFEFRISGAGTGWTRIIGLWEKSKRRREGPQWWEEGGMATIGHARPASGILCNE